MRRPLLAHVAGAVVAGVLALGIGVPWWALLREAGAGAGWGVLVEERILGRLAYTAGQAFASTLLAVLLGLPAAIAFGTVRVPGARVWRALFTVPFVMPSVVAAIALLAWVGPRGLLPLDLRDTIWIVLLAHATYNVGIVVRVVGGYLEGLAPRLHEAAAVLGAHGWARLLRVTLPVAAPAVLAAATLVFVFCFTSFGVIMILAPAPAFATLEVEVYRAAARRVDLVEAAALATLQLVVVMSLVVLYTRWQRGLAHRVQRSAAPPPPPRGRASWALVGVSVALAGIATLAPPAALAVQAFIPPGASAPTLAAFEGVMGRSSVIGLTDGQSALRNSLAIASAATALALLLGTTAAYAIVRGGWTALDALTLLPLATSAVTLGLGVLLSYPGVAAAPAAIPVAHALLAFPFVARVLVSGWRGLEGSLAPAAASLGASPARTLWRVELPLLAPAILSATGFALAISLGEFGATLVLRRPETATLPIAIFERLGRPGAAHYAEALALAFVLLALTAMVVLLFEILARRRGGAVAGEL
ncbi:iron ABC transporter permease [soil metagenome]|nr:iron ABC transporter permease [Trueperaceae bacterium]